MAHTQQNKAGTARPLRMPRVQQATQSEREGDECNEKRTLRGNRNPQHKPNQNQTKKRRSPFRKQPYRNPSPAHRVIGTCGTRPGCQVEGKIQPKPLGSHRQWQLKLMQVKTTTTKNHAPKHTTTAPTNLVVPLSDRRRFGV